MCVCIRLFSFEYDTFVYLPGKDVLIFIFVYVSQHMGCFWKHLYISVENMKKFHVKVVQLFFFLSKNLIKNSKFERNFDIRETPKSLTVGLTWKNYIKPMHTLMYISNKMPDGNTCSTHKLKTLRLIIIYKTS